MARATTQEALIEQATGNYQLLVDAINRCSPEEQVGEFPFEGRDRQIRDCLVHLHEWHLLFIHWVTQNQSGHAAPFLPANYNWKTYPEMNIQFWQKHQVTPLETAKRLFADSHHKCIEIILGFSDDELFTKKYFTWTGTTSLGSYAVSATSSHYDWALKIIKKYQKSLIKK